MRFCYNTLCFHAIQTFTVFSSYHSVLVFSYGWTPSVYFCLDSGLVFTVGSNKNNQLGYQRVKGDLRPQLVESLSKKKIQHISCGDTYTVAITTGTLLMVWIRPSRSRLTERVLNVYWTCTSRTGRLLLLELLIYLRLNALWSFFPQILFWQRTFVSTMSVTNAHYSSANTSAYLSVVWILHFVYSCLWFREFCAVVVCF